ncbi:MAG TPA: RDD family protein [Drouetiella sp.]|jgi:uncharacterized RDD family membrane protein YckC
MFLDEPDLITAAPIVLKSQYASFADRAFAGVLDAIILTVVETIGFSSINLITGNTWSVLTHAILPCAISFLYYPIMECSSWQATVGKRCFGLMVTDNNGKKLSLIRAFFKQTLQTITGTILFAGIFLLCASITNYSSLNPTAVFFTGIFIANVLYFGMHCAIVFTQKKQSVFDKVTGRLVYKRRFKIIED